ncbi:hypothetical protein EEB14_00670 [Rhodococcus sp. WS4]|nr:hypothetical protein EEB14_00670 [Rhodococcus sp. WS4]
MDDPARAAGLESAAPGPALPVERDDAAIATWVQQDSAHKKAYGAAAPGSSFQDESGFPFLPRVRAAWAPKGHTPVLRHRFSRARLSMSGALAYRLDAE